MNKSFGQNPPDGAPRTLTEGVPGAVAGVIGVLQAREAVKYLLGVGDLLVGRMLVYDALGANLLEVPLTRDDTTCREKRAWFEFV